MNIESRPIRKPLHMQSVYVEYPIVAVDDGFIVCEDICQREICLPSDNNMTAEIQAQVEKSSGLALNNTVF